MSVQNRHEEFDDFWSKHSKISKLSTLMSCFWPNYIMSELKKYREVMYDSTEDWCKTWRLKNSDFILESKMVELNQSQNSKHPDGSDSVWKLYFTLEING